MRKLTLSRTDGITFEEGCNKYLDNYRQRNLRTERRDTIGRHTRSYSNTSTPVCPYLIVIKVCITSMFATYKAF